MVSLFVATRAAPPPSQGHDAPGGAPAAAAPASEIPDPVRSDGAVRAAADSATTDIAPPADEAVRSFDAWAERWSSAPPAERSSMEQEGLRLARARREAMRTLIRENPERALREALPFARRSQLPAAVAALLEQPVSAAGSFEVLIACGFGDTHHHDALDRITTAGGRRYETFTYGRRLDVTTKNEISVHGIAVDDLLALSDAPVRVMPDEERAARGIAGPGLAVEVLGEVRRLSGTNELARLEAALIAQEDVVDPDAKAPRDGGGGPAPLSTYTEGAKTLLYIRCDFPDHPGFPTSLATLSNAMNNVAQYWDETSHARCTLAPTFVPVVIRLPQTGAYYVTRFSSLIADAKAAALSNGYNAADYNFLVVVTRNGGGFNFGYAGKAWIGSAGCHVVDPYYTLRTLGHELGHNFGLYHANYWRTDSDCPIGRDSPDGGYVTNGIGREAIEYGHRFTIMSAQNSSDMNDRTAQFAAREKVRMDWLKGTDVRVLTNSALVRLYRHDHRDATGTPRAIHIDRPTSDYTGVNRRYWLSYRAAYADNGWLQRGLQFDWVRPTYGQDGAMLLDMTPYSNDDGSGATYTDDNADKWDSPLLIGRTYSDPNHAIHVTPTGRGGTAPNEWLDVVVNLGTFPDNRAPALALAASSTTPAVGQAVVFTATAGDPDGDALAYEWDFGLPKIFAANALNVAQPTHSWSVAGEYVVRCVVSDMKGGATSTSLVVRVGNPGTRHQIRGRVLADGQAVAGARVYTANTNMTYTGSDGGYILANLGAGAFTVQAQRHGLTLAQAFDNPVTVGPSADGRDFGAEGSPALRLTPAENVEVAEGGGGATYLVSLASRPTAAVAVSLGLATNQLACTPTSLLLQPNDWLHGRTVTVTAIDDALVEGSPHASSVSHALASADPGYHALPAPPLIVSIADNDINTPPFVAVTRPDDAVAVVQGEPVSVQVAAADEEGIVTQVVCYANAEPVATFASEEQYELEWNDTAPGDYTLVAMAWDDEGATSTSTPVQVIVLADLDRDGVPDVVDDDDDNDGMPDAFEEHFFGGATNGSPTADTDKDGFSNLSEQIAGTDPTDAHAYFRVASFLVDGPGEIAYASVTGRLYTLQYCEGLLAGNTWSNVAARVDVPGNGGPQSLADPDATSARLYRLLVRSP